MVPGLYSSTRVPGIEYYTTELYSVSQRAHTSVATCTCTWRNRKFLVKATTSSARVSSPPRGDASLGELAKLRVLGSERRELRANGVVHCVHWQLSWPTLLKCSSSMITTALEFRAAKKILSRTTMQLEKFRVEIKNCVKHYGSYRYTVHEQNSAKWILWRVPVGHRRLH